MPDRQRGVTVLELRDISRRDSPIHYRRQYSATAVMAHIGNRRQSVSVAFTVEQSATGASEVAVNIDRSLDYPLLPASRALREYITMMEREGRLP